MIENIGQHKMNQVYGSFRKDNDDFSKNILKSYGYSEDEINTPIVFNDEYLQKGKLDTSHLVLKDVNVNGKMQKRWIDPNKGDAEYAKHGSDVEFSHKGTNMKGKVGSILKTGEYAIRGEDGKTYNKHPHQFKSSEIKEKVEAHASTTDTDKLKEFVSNEKNDPKLVDIAKKELEKRGDDENDGKESEQTIPPTKPMSKEDFDEAEYEAEVHDVNKRFKTFEAFVKQTALGFSKSTIAYGTGGVGKTYTATKALEHTINPETGKPFVFYDEDIHEAGSDDYDAIKITGKATTAGLYKLLYQHNGKLLMFDDCDEVLKDPNSINMFKGALDTSGDGTISNTSGKAIKGDDGQPIPQRYKFSGRAIFISNLSPKDLPQPIKSRSLRIDLSMDEQQTIDRIKNIAQDKKNGKYTNIKIQTTSGKDIKYDSEDMEEAIKFLDKYKKKTGDLNVRTLGNIVKLIVMNKNDEDADDNEWMTQAKQFIFSKGFGNELNKQNQIEKAFKSLSL